jgi:hypothetical protein
MFYIKLIFLYLNLKNHVGLIFASNICLNFNFSLIIFALKLFVRGKAEQAYNVAFTANKKTYKELRVEITNTCQLSKEQRLKIFYEKKMNDGESVRDYAQVLNSLLIKAVPNLDEADMSALVQGQLVNNVPSELKPMMTIASALGSPHFNTVINTMCAQTDQLIVDLGLVKHEHSEMNYTQVNRRNYNNNNNASNRINVQYNGNNNMRKNNNTDSRSVPFDGVCYNCNAYGHRIAFCTEPKQSLIANANRSNAQGNNNNNNYHRNNNSQHSRPNIKSHQICATNNSTQEIGFDFTEHMMVKSSEVVVEVGQFDEMLFNQRVKDSEINSLSVDKKVKLLQTAISLKLVSQDAFVRVDRCL